MTHLDPSSPLAAALAAKGYSSLTPVQQAVLSPDALGRDLLVSAQTGSGKTVAFGLAVAPEVLDGHGPLPPAATPLALVIAPTRELALQVARELRWLYAQAGAQVATCVGGMDIRNERRALERGAHVVVGTPGRLRDHIERGSLGLAALRVAVLDEADEMLDLGFREDLEFILRASSDTRRTLMFSATVPRAIEELAREFQRDALRIQTAGEARQHADIEYRALSVTARDREHAIFNLLRLHDARSAIIFCKTRANVSHLLARLSNRGFKVVPLSGELSQGERTHALQALRDGRARVCVATDVAARGIDLPGLELVIHADLPTNSETLLHRSGRTGRAGAKGVSALIVTPAEYKKAQRLLQGAKVVAEWGKAPSADEVQARDDARLLEHLALLPDPGEEAAMAASLLGRYGAERVAAAFVQLWREGRSAPEELSDEAPAGSPRSGDRSAFGDSVWFTLSAGRDGRAEARWLLPKICQAGGITKDAVGAIRVQPDETFVQIAAVAADGFGSEVEIAPGLFMRRLAGEPVLVRSERRPSEPAARSFRGAGPRRGARNDPGSSVSAAEPGSEQSHSGADSPSRPIRADEQAPIDTDARADALGARPQYPRAVKPWAARKGAAAEPRAAHGDHKRARSGPGTQGRTSPGRPKKPNR